MFVGRIEERARLEQHYETARARSQIVVVVGETGIGKSRLVNEFVTERQSAGATVLTGSAPPIVGTDLPFAPVAAALRQLRDSLSASELESLVAPESELARLLPGAALELASGSSSMAHLRLLEESLTLLTAIGRRSHHPAVLVLEDLHWADRSTLTLCAYLFRNLGTPGTLVILTSRTTDAADASEWGDLVREGLREPHVHELSLGRLDDDEIRLILNAASPSVLNEQALSAAVSRAGGNPLFAAEIGRAGGRLPASISGIARRRLERVSAPARAFFGLTAAAGGRLDASIVHTAAVRLRLDVPAATEELRRADLLVVATDGQLTVYQPAHPALFEIAYVDLAPAERAAFHGALAEALTSRVTPADPMGTVELGRHWAAAGDPARAHEPLVRAALAAEQLLAFPEAHQLFERALATRPAAGRPTRAIGFQPPRPPDDASWLLNAARCAALAGNPARAVELVDLLGSARNPKVAAARAEYLMEAGRTDDALRAYGELLAAAEIDARTRYAAARAFLVLGDTARAKVVAEEALRQAVDEGDLRSEAHAARVLAVVHTQRGDIPSATTLLRRAHAIDEQRVQASRIEPTPSRIVDALAGLWTEATVRRQAGHTSEQPSLAPSMRRIGELAAASGWTAKLHGATIHELIELGRWVEADDLVERLATTGSVPREMALAHARMLALRGASSHAAEALSTSGGAPEVSASHRPLHGLAFAELAYWTGHPLESLESARDALATIPPGTAVPDELELLALGLRALGEVSGEPRATDRASIADHLLELESRFGTLRAAVSGGRGEVLVLWCEAELSRAKTSSFDGGHVWRDLAEAWARLSEPFGRAYALYRFAESRLASRAGREDAGSALRTAHTVAVELGAEPLRSAIEALARRARVALTEEDVPAADSSSDLPKGAQFGLSTRELEVLALLAEGRTNRQIGEALFITEKTAGHHVSSILGKLGAKGRVEAAGIALREGLTPSRSIPPVDHGERADREPTDELVLMFTDMVKSTALVEAIGDATWADLAAWHDRTLRAIFQHHGGREIDHAGDGFFVRFVDLPAALDCAIEIQRRLVEHRRSHGFAPRLRIAIHRTSAVIDGQLVRGRGVHLAARLAAAAAGDEILVSADSLGPLDGRYPRGEPRQLDLRGVGESMTAVPIEWRTH